MRDISEREIKEKLAYKQRKLCDKCSCNVNECFKCPIYNIFLHMYEEVGLSYRKKK